MFEDRSYKRTFYSAPQSVTSLVAAFLEPTVSVVTFLLVNQYYDEPVLRSTLTLCLLIFALTFPGRNRFKDSLLTAGVDIVTSWVSLLVILALCGYATRSIGLFEPDVLIAWAVLTPVFQWIGVWIGQMVLRRQASMPHETATTSVARPASFRRTASSTAISSNGLMAIFTLARSTPVLSGLTRTLTLASTTRFTGTRIFMSVPFTCRRTRAR